MGLGPIMAIYQARFNKYLEDRGIKDTRQQKVWCFIGDGESDEPETLGAITLASRENLDNLIFVVNCNLQRLDGPVRGNGKIIQELEAIFRGAGWNVIKVIWGDDWDSLLEKDETGLLINGWEKWSTANIKNMSSRRAATFASTFSASIRNWRNWSSSFPTRSLPSCAAAGTIRKRCTRRSRRPLKRPASRRSFWQKPSRATDLAKPAKAATLRTTQRR